MTCKTHNLIISAAVAALLTTTAAIGGTTVSRCEFKALGNYYLPGIRVCSPTEITDIKLGEEGLTREIFFDDKALMQYAKSKFDLSPLDISAGVCNRCDGQLDEEDFTPDEVSDYEGPTNDSISVDEPASE